MTFLSRVRFSSPRKICTSGYFIPKTNYSFRHHCCFEILTGRVSAKPAVSQISARYLSSDKGPVQKFLFNLYQKDKLKQAIKDYGVTILVFHIMMSIASVGICYLVVSNGIDAVAILKRVGFSESFISSKVAVGGSTFVVAYAVHKLILPLRAGITLSAAPFIVKYLRNTNLIKSSKPKL